MRVFLEHRASSLFYIYNGLTSCEIAEKSNDGKYEIFVSLTDRQTDGQTDETFAVISFVKYLLIVIGPYNTY